MKSLFKKQKMIQSDHFRMIQHSVMVFLLCLISLLSSCENTKALSSEVESEQVVNNPIPVSTEPINRELIITNAIQNLRNSSSFETSSHEIRAYQAISPDQSSKIIYGEFNRKCDVINTPSIKVSCSVTYRYSPESEFLSSRLFYWQENQKYFQKEIARDNPTQILEIEVDQVEPFSNDVYKTLVDFGVKAEFIQQKDNIAQFRLVHPEWYKLSSALGFTNLGLFDTNKGDDRLLKEYLTTHYLNVRPPIFTIYVDVSKELITSVEIDDEDFMISVWEDIDQELIKQNVDKLTLTKYEVLESNSSVHNFDRFNQVPDFPIQ